jgi:hypothetical protein
MIEEEQVLAPIMPRGCSYTLLNNRELLKVAIDLVSNNRGSTETYILITLLLLSLYFL